MRTPLRHAALSFVFVLAAFVLLPPSAQAQVQAQAPIQPRRFQIFGGYSILRPDARDATPVITNVIGWGASVTDNIYRNIGLTADFGGYYRRLNVDDARVRASAYSFMFGPTVTVRGNRQVTPFFHALAGFAWVSASGKNFNGVGLDETAHGFVGAVGGGTDIALSSTIAVRVIEFDYLPAHHNDTGFLHNVRWRSGIVVSFGN